GNPGQSRCTSKSPDRKSPAKGVFAGLRGDRRTTSACRGNNRPRQIRVARSCSLLSLGTGSRGAGEPRNQVGFVKLYHIAAGDGAGEAWPAGAGLTNVARVNNRFRSLLRSRT